MALTYITHAVVRRPIHHPKLADIREIPRPRYKGHWAVGTRHLEEANRFYEILTGTQVICQPSSFSTAVSWDDEHHRFFIMDVTCMKKDPATGADISPADGTPQQRTGVGLASIRYASPQALARVYGQMAANGFLPERIVDRGIMVSLIYRDPDELLVEVFAKVPDGTAAKDYELSTDAFLKKFG